MPDRSRFFRRLPARVRLAFLLIFCAVFIPGGSAGAARSLPSSGKVVAVFDGDTVLLASGVKVRYLGIDAPETAHGDEPAGCYGDRARAENASLVMGRTVTLAYGERRRDVHGRLLAFVHLPDGLSVNEELVRRGAALVFRTEEGLSGLERFLALQREAMREGRGLWGACPADSSPPYAGNRRSFVFHRRSCPLAGDISRRNRVVISSRVEAFDKGYHPCRHCKP